MRKKEEQSRKEYIMKLLRINKKINRDRENMRKSRIREKMSY